MLSNSRRSLVQGERLVRRDLTATVMLTDPANSAPTMETPDDRGGCKLAGKQLLNSVRARRGWSANENARPHALAHPKGLFRKPNFVKVLNFEHCHGGKERGLRRPDPTIHQEIFGGAMLPVALYVGIICSMTANSNLAASLLQCHSLKTRACHVRTFRRTCDNETTPNACATIY